MNNNSKQNSTDTLHPDRLFPADPGTRAIARRLYNTVSALPIISPHGHTDPRWFADNAPFSDPVSLLLTPDHYITRMLYSQGLSLEELGVAPLDTPPGPTPAPAPSSGGALEPRAIWGKFAAHYHL
ncbi:MAG: glucuronate isomerase, partial [Steroidobacteraceae bacterium]